MGSHILVRSQALNNIPFKKKTGKIHTILQSCEVCSKRNSDIDLVDGLCPQCSLKVVACNRYYESNIPVEYWGLKMEKDFFGSITLSNKYNEIVGDLRTNYINGTSICFGGGHGLGKTMTITCILKKAVEKGYTVLYSTLSDIVNVLISSEEKFEARRELTMVDFLAIDEFDGRFMPTENAADLYARTLEGIFRTRSQNKLPTLMATNSPNPEKAFTGELYESIDSLFKGYIKVLPVVGEDFRKKNK